MLQLQTIFILVSEELTKKQIRTDYFNRFKKGTDIDDDDFDRKKTLVLFQTLLPRRVFHRHRDLIWSLIYEGLLRSSPLYIKKHHVRIRWRLRKPFTSKRSSATKAQTSSEQSAATVMPTMQMPRTQKRPRSSPRTVRKKW